MSSSLMHVGKGRNAPYSAAYLVDVLRLKLSTSISLVQLPPALRGARACFVQLSPAQASQQHLAGSSTIAWWQL